MEPVPSIRSFDRASSRLACLATNTTLAPFPTRSRPNLITDDGPPVHASTIELNEPGLFVHPRSFPPRTRQASPENSFAPLGLIRFRQAAVSFAKRIATGTNRRVASAGVAAPLK